MKIDKSWFIKPKDPKFPKSTAAGGVVMRKEKGKLLIALISNDYYDDYLLPKGRQEDGEEIEKTAEREISEETGLVNIKLICKLGVKERLTFKKTEWKTSHYFLFETNDISGQQNLQQGEEGLKLCWFNLDDLPAIFFPEQKELIEENREKIKLLLQSRN